MNRYFLDSTRNANYLSVDKALPFLRIALINVRADFRGGPCEDLFDWLVNEAVDHHFTLVESRTTLGERHVRAYLMIADDDAALALRLRYNITPIPADQEQNDEQWMGVEYRILF